MLPWFQRKIFNMPSIIFLLNNERICHLGFREKYLICRLLFFYLTMKEYITLASEKIIWYDKYCN